MSMWEPRSSHLYVCTGLRVCEWLRVGAGTPCLCPAGDRVARACTCPCGPWRVCVCSVHMVCDLPLRTFHRVPFSVCVSGM